MTQEELSQAEPAPTREILALARSDIGMRREENQDSYGIVETEAYRLYIVADGMGGVKGGALASSLAVETIKEHLSKAEQITADVVREAVQAANSEIFARGSSEPSLSGMGTTLTGLLFLPDQTLVINVGDSRVYLARGDRITCLTQDHTLVMELLRSGTIDIEQAKNHPVSHMLTRSLGPAETVEVDCYPLERGPFRGDVFILCSDGLYNLMSDSEILTMLQDKLLEPAVEKLIDLANARGGTDNITVIGIEIGLGFPEPPASEVEVEIDIIPSAQESASQSEGEPNSLQQSAGVNGVSAQHVNGHSVGAEIKSGQATKSEQKPDSSMSTTQRLAQAARKPSARPGLGQQSKLAAASAQKQAAPAAPPVKPFFSSTAGGLLSIFGALIAGYMVALLMSAPPSFSREDGTGAFTSNVAPNPDQSGAARNRDIGEKVQPAAANPPQREAEEIPLEQGVPGVGWNDIRSLQRRREAVAQRLDQVQNMVLAFQRPISGELAERASQAERERKALMDRLEGVRGEMDIATRALALWYGRRKRLENTEPINLVSEVAVSSEDVRIKKAAFESATWDYLKEVEKLEFNPNDQVLTQKVNELVRARNVKMQELIVSVRDAIDRAIGDSHQRIAELTMERDRLVGEIRSLEEDLQFVRILTTGDSKSKEMRKSQLLKEKEQLEAELGELSRLAEPLPEAVSSSADIIH